MRKVAMPYKNFEEFLRGKFKSEMPDVHNRYFESYWLPRVSDERWLKLGDEYLKAQMEVKK